VVRWLDRFAFDFVRGGSYSLPRDHFLSGGARNALLGAPHLTAVGATLDSGRVMPAAGTERGRQMAFLLIGRKENVDFARNRGDFSWRSQSGDIQPSQYGDLPIDPF
jgi:hypothetical protein